MVLRFVAILALIFFEQIVSFVPIPLSEMRAEGGVDGIAQQYLDGGEGAVQGICERHVPEVVD
jgi:hypothetical protein